MPGKEFKGAPPLSMRDVARSAVNPKDEPQAAFPRKPPVSKGRETKS